MNKIKWIIFTTFTIGILVVLVVVSNNSKIDVSKIDVNDIQVANSANDNIADHVFGKIGSKVTLIEYGDYQCPPCANIYPVVKSISEKYKDQIQFVFRNFPITSAHPNAKAAAATAESAGLQDKFWEMHNKIYETQSDWSNLSIAERGTFFENLASELKLDITKFKADIAESKINEKISYDTALAKKAGVEGTPSFYLNGTLVDSDTYGSESKFKEAINAELTKVGIALPE